MSINKVAISGNLGGDPTMRATSSGKYILSFSLAVNERIPDGNGGWTDRANWIKVAVFGGRATALEHILKKGMKVAVSGRLRQNTYERNGQKHNSVEVVADEVDIMSARSADPTPDDSYDQMPEPNPAPAPDAGVYDEDIPF